MNLVDQVPWVAESVVGHSWVNGEIDLTEGFGAYDHVFELGGLGTRIIDVGGGAYDANSAYAAQKYLVECTVYDPYKRDAKHNFEVIEESKMRPFDAALSFSVLNVISDEQSRQRHIKLCRDLLKTGGQAVFKVWPGDGTGIGRETSSGYQCNQDIDKYVDEIRKVFGSQNVIFDSERKIIRGINPIVAYPSGTHSI